MAMVMGVQLAMPLRIGQMHPNCTYRRQESILDLANASADRSHHLMNGRNRHRNTCRSHRQTTPFDRMAHGDSFAAIGVHRSLNCRVNLAIRCPIGQRLVHSRHYYRCWIFCSL